MRWDQLQIYFTLDLLIYLHKKYIYITNIFRFYVLIWKRRMIGEHLQQATLNDYRYKEKDLYKAKARMWLVGSWPGQYLQHVWACQEPADENSVTSRIKLLLYPQTIMVRPIKSYLFPGLHYSMHDKDN